jgi:hypothetical protein
MNKIILSITLIFVASISHAQVVKLSGPRIGATVVTAGSASDFIQNDLMTPGDDGWGNSSTLHSMVGSLKPDLWKVMRYLAWWSGYF